MKKIIHLYTVGLLSIASLNANIAIHNQSIYSYIEFSEPLSWADAKTNAEGRGGHLATITSNEEWLVVVNLIDETLGRNNYDAQWIGAYEADNDGQPGLEWNWVTGEEWGFTSWYSGLTTLNPFGDDVVYLMANSNSSWSPSNSNPKNKIGAMILETSAVPEPATYAAILGGLGLCLVVLRRK